MTDINRNNLNYQSWRARVLFRLKIGLQFILSDKNALRNTIFLICVFVAYWGIRYVMLVPSENEVMAVMQWKASKVTSILFISLISVIYLISYSQPLEALRSHQALLRAGFINSVGEPPMLISLTFDGPIMRYQYTAEGITLNIWEDNKEVLENALNIVIGQIKETSDKQHILMTAVDGGFHYPEKMYWKARENTEKDEIVISSKCCLF